MNRFSKEQSDAAPGQPDRPRPMRSFDYSTSNGSGTSAKRSFKFKAFLLLMLLLVVSLAGFLGFLFINGEDEPVASSPAAGSTPAAEPVPLISIPEIVPTLSTRINRTTVPDLLEAHIDALGGRKALQDVRSIRYQGKVAFTSGESDFQMLVLSPDKGMLVTNPGEANSQKLMLNGDVAWRVVERRDGSREVSALSEESVRSLRWSLRVHNTLREFALNSQHDGLQVQEIEYSGKPCFELTRTMPDGSEFSAILDQETLYLLKLVETLQTGGTKHEFTVTFGDYRMVSGVVEPFTTTLYRNGELDNEVQVESIQINPGVISSLFRVPDELRD